MRKYTSELIGNVVLGDNNALLVNFYGIGNGVGIVPILKCVEDTFPKLRYFHTENPALSNSWFGKKSNLKSLRGFVPSRWRRFGRADWEPIAGFTQGNLIDLIVNVRNEGPRFDGDYYSFKAWAQEAIPNVSFCDLDFDVIENRPQPQNLSGDIMELFRRKGTSFSSFDPHWLTPSAGKRSGVGFGLAASQRNKRWGTPKWVALGRQVQCSCEAELLLVAGLTKDERRQADEVAEQLHCKSDSVLASKSLSHVIEQIARLRCFVSNDTGLLHIAAATGTPAIGLYVCTDARVWSPLGAKHFKAFQNSIFIDRCPGRKIHAGNCEHYYGACPAVGEHGDDIDPIVVCEAMLPFLA